MMRPPPAFNALASRQGILISARLDPCLMQLAARVCDRAEPGQVLVSKVVKELCTGKLFQFADRGEATLKGFPDPIRLFVVTPTAAPTTT